MSQYEGFTAPMLAGTQSNWLLLGMLTLQAYKFHVSFPNESRWIKAMAYTLYALELGQTAVTSHFAYSTLVTSWGDPTIFVQLPWSSLAPPIFTGITSATVQIFFAWRIYTLKKRFLWARITAALIVLVALMQRRVLPIMTTNVAEFPHLLLGVKVWLFGSAACDVVITLVMLYILTEYRRATPWKSTDSVVTKLIYNTVETGAITSVVAIVDVTLFIKYTDTNYHQFCAFMLGKLYTSVLFVTLNSRAEMRRVANARLTETRAGDATDVSDIQWRRNGPKTVPVTTFGLESVPIPSSSLKSPRHLTVETEEDTIKDSHVDHDVDVYELNTKKYDGTRTV
ncbi:hypothetical protein MKEN_00490800 [Mycena kentingensis (nom. inval.)]|nr:hypothetical protein MKEN_00490800 [Mycena kentingensis (nom. inval.)]